ncbi:MAG: DEAD/DEAH box helicase [Deltaproteobacteria bacterium]|nr:DEAD/DEAH box helicase [Deltaproteobacteria bacterium]
MTSRVYRTESEVVPRILYKMEDDAGIPRYLLLRHSSRFWSADAPRPELVKKAYDVQRDKAPSELLWEVPEGDNVQAQTRRSIARLFAWFLLAEDPQRRLEVRPVATLAHQVSLVRHVYENPNLRRVLIADEVGLGKTVEAGMLIQRILADSPSKRVIYFSPASLVENVAREFRRLGLTRFRVWASGDSTADIEQDSRIIASVHRAAHGKHLERILKGPPWDVIVVDECHHLSAWESNGGKPTRKYTLIHELLKHHPSNGWLILLSGTPHQGAPVRFDNLLKLLQADKEPRAALEGRVIYRIKDDIRDWDGNPLFPARRVNPPTVVDLGEQHRRWLKTIHRLFSARSGGQASAARQRGASWRALLALQWAASSVHAGLGFIARQALRAGWTLEEPLVREALAALRPYRGGSRDEPVEHLFQRLDKEIQRNSRGHELEDSESADELDADEDWTPDRTALSDALEQGIKMAQERAHEKWTTLFEKVLGDLEEEKVVLFAQPVETVTALAEYVRERTGRMPALIIGDQTEYDRNLQIEGFRSPDGPQFLISSRAGAEGLNLQVARRLVHLDVPWNPMQLEQRVGRVHRFGSRREIIVDTLVVKESREEAAYSIARRKLQTIASTMGEGSRFEVLYARVMALVPPNELEAILANGAVGPLSDTETEQLSQLVASGHAKWSEFHERYRETHNLSTPDRGEATWEDLRDFAVEHLKAETDFSFSSLAFKDTENGPVESSPRVSVLRIENEPFVVDDDGGMPVHSKETGESAKKLGTNSPPFLSALAKIGWPDRHPTGGAHVTLTGNDGDMVPGFERPFGFVVIIVQYLREEGGLGLTEQGMEMRAATVQRNGDRSSLSPKDTAALVRALRTASRRREPLRDEFLLEAISAAESEMLAEASQITTRERNEGIRRAVFPLMAATVA